MTSTAVLITTAIAGVVGLLLSVLVIRAGLAPVHRQLARIADEFEARNAADLGGDEQTDD